MCLNSSINGILCHGSVGCPLPTCNHTFASLFRESKGNHEVAMYYTFCIPHYSYQTHSNKRVTLPQIDHYLTVGMQRITLLERSFCIKYSGEAQSHTWSDLQVPAIVTRPLSLTVTTWFRDIDWVSLELGSVTRGRMPLHAANTSPLLTVQRKDQPKSVMNRCVLLS